MESPDNSQQETTSEKLGDMISDTFDTMEAESTDEVEEVELSSDNETETEVEVEEETEVEEVEASSEEEEIDTLNDEVQQAADSDYNEPAPERWEQDIKDYYNGLDPKGKEIFLDRMVKPMQRSLGKASQEVADMRKDIQPVLDTMSQYRADFERMGVNPIEAFNTQMAWVKYIQDVGAEKGLAEMAKAYGVKGNAKPAGQENAYLTPTERAQQGKIDQLQNTVDGMQKTNQQNTDNAAQQTVERQQNEIKENLTTFINEKTDDGKPLHPHMEKVASNVAGIIRGGMIAKTDDFGQPVSISDQLAQAYTMACELDPSIRTPRTSARQAARIKTTQKAQVVTKTPAGRVSAKDDIPISKFIENTYDKMAKAG